MAFRRIGSGRFRVRDKYLIDMKGDYPDRYIPFVKRMPSDMSDREKKIFQDIKKEHRQFKKKFK